MRRAFTLIEMVIVLLIIGVLAALALSAMNAAYQQSKVQRTRAIIAKLDQLIMEKWEGYRTRQVPIRIPNGRYPNGQPWMQPIGEPFADSAGNNLLTNGIWDGGENYTDVPYPASNQANGIYDLGTAEYRLLAMRELQRMEMPNQIADVVQGPLVMLSGPPPIINQPIFPRPALSQQYLRRAINATGGNLNNWTSTYQGAECLYLIVAAMRDSGNHLFMPGGGGSTGSGDKSGLDYFSPSEIGDVDGDGMSEILDSFGQPVEFVRWPCGYRSDIAPFPATPQDGNSPDPFDPMKVDGRVRQSIPTIALKPLIYSAGPDKQYSIRGAGAGSILADPYHVDFVGNPPNLAAGSPYDPNGYDGYADNITNHDLEAR